MSYKNQCHIKKLIEQWTDYRPDIICISDFLNPCYESYIFIKIIAATNLIQYKLFQCQIDI